LDIEFTSSKRLNDQKAVKEEMWLKMPFIGVFFILDVHEKSMDIKPCYPNFLLNWRIFFVDKIHVNPLVFFFLTN